MVSPTMFIITVGFFVSVSHSAFSAGHTGIIACFIHFGFINQSINHEIAI